VRTFSFRLMFSVLMFITLVSQNVQAESSSPNIVNHETEGNLEVTHQIGCVGFSELSNKYTPADLYHGFAQCLRDENYEIGSQLFVLAGVYATFDKLRVADGSAHQAHTVLLMRAMEGVPKDRKDRMMEALNGALTKGSAKLTETCQTVRKIGAPDYFPGYMIQHGIKAFTGPQANRGLIPEFKKESAWEESLAGYLHCSAK
jgi:hypothetical protein